VFFGDVAQQILLAQHSDRHAFCSGALERRHDRAARPTGAVKSAAAIAIEMMILLNIALHIAQVRPRVVGKRSALSYFTCSLLVASRICVYDYEHAISGSLFSTRPLVNRGSFRIATNMLVVIMESSGNYP
jgi:hypothetical protein